MQRVVISQYYCTFRYRSLYRVLAGDDAEDGETTGEVGHR